MTELTHDRARRRATMSDVGRAANVSAQTVSRFYTGGYVSPATRSRIEAAVNELDYKHNKLPQILRSTRTNTIGYLSMGPLNFGNAGNLIGISRAARAAGQALITTQLDLDPSAEGSKGEILHALENFLSMRVDGIVVGTPYVGLQTLLESFGRSVPIVSMSEAVYDGIFSVHVDSYGAARLAMEHLVSLGHRRILHLAGPSNRNEASERERGYLDVLRESGHDPLPVLRCTEWDAVSGAEVAELADPAQYTAVFAGNDEIALGFMSVMHGRGLNAPQDYSIAGVDDMPEAAYFSPPLTSARLDFERLGETAFRAILARITADEDEPKHVVPSSLAIRESTARLVESHTDAD